MKEHSFYTEISREKAKTLFSLEKKVFMSIKDSDKIVRASIKDVFHTNNLTYYEKK